MTALVLAPACASSSEDVKVIRSQQAPTPLDRIYIVVFQGELGGDRAEHLRHALADAFQPRISAVATMVATGMELDKGPARADIDAFRPDGILVIRPAGGVTPKAAGGYSVSYDVVVLTPRQERTMWRAMLVSEAGAEVMARDLVKHLAWDGLLNRQAADDLLREEQKPEPE